MAKRTGLNQKLWVGGYDVSGDVGTVERCSTPVTMQEVTGLDVDYVERIPTQRSGEMAFRSFFNDATDRAFDAFSGLPTTDVLALWAIGQSIGDPAAMIVAKQMNYDLAKNDDGSVEMPIEFMSNAQMLEWGEMLTAAEDTFASSGAAASKDDAAGTSDGLAAQLHIESIDSGTPTFVLEDSANDSTWATLISFTAVASGSEPTAERKTVSGSVDRYLRLNPTGTFTNAVVAVAYRRGTSTDAEAY